MMGNLLCTEKMPIQIPMADLDVKGHFFTGGIQPLICQYLPEIQYPPRLAGSRNFPSVFAGNSDNTCYELSVGFG